MAHPKARWEKGSPETKARMAAVSQKAKEAREARTAVMAAPPSTSKAPFTSPVMSRTIDVNEFTGHTAGGFQTSFGPNFLGEVRTQTWPGDKGEKR